MEDRNVSAWYIVKYVVVMYFETASSQYAWNDWGEKLSG